jgi:fluoride exporter
VIVAGFAVCAAVGAVVRWRLGSTLLVNLTGAFALGCLVGSDIGAPTTTIVGTGLLGAYTTFSTFVREIHEGDRPPLYVALSVGGGILAALAGLAVTG